MMPHSILVLEDNADDLFLIKRAILQACANVEVEGVQTCEAALAWLTKQDGFTSPALIIVDGSVRCESGMNFTRLVRQEGKFERTTVIMLSGSSDPNLMQAAYANGVDCYLQKPQSYHELRDLIGRTCKEWLGREMVNES